MRASWVALGVEPGLSFCSGLEAFGFFVGKKSRGGCSGVKPLGRVFRPRGLGRVARAHPWVLAWGPAEAVGWGLAFSSGILRMGADFEPDRTCSC